jgi:hypothetical protein
MRIAVIQDTQGRWFVREISSEQSRIDFPRRSILLCGK